MHEKRKKEIKLRRNYMPTLVVTISLWITLILVVLFIDPSLVFSVPLFFTLCFAAFFFTSALFLANSKKGLVVSVGITMFLTLAYFGVGNVLNALLIFGVTIAILLIL